MSDFYGKLLRSGWLVRVGDKGIVYAREEGIGRELVCGEIKATLANLHYNAFADPQRFKEVVFLYNGNKDFVVPLRARATASDEFWHRRAALLDHEQGPRTNLDHFLPKPVRRFKGYMLAPSGRIQATVLIEKVS